MNTLKLIEIVDKADDNEHSLALVPADTLKKFAELIIRECAQVCRDQPNIFAMKLDRENCAIAIEEHFGVEE